MSADPGQLAGFTMASLDAQPHVGPLRPADQAGRLRALREAEDDARAVLAFLHAGMRSRSIHPGHAVWIVDLCPGDGERAWRMLRIFDREAPRGPPLRYLACCADPARHDALAMHAPLAQWRADGRFSLDGEDRGLPLHPLCNPVVVLAHDAFSARAQHLFRIRGGEILQAWRDASGRVRWRDLRRRDGLCRLLSAQPGACDDLSLTLPHAGMALLDAILRASGGRMLLRATDDGLYEPVRIATEGLRVVGDDPPQVNFDALSRWHHANGGQSFQSRGPIDGRVLHVALHDVEGGRLRECLPEVLALPHPDEHVQLLQALSMLVAPSDAARRALFRATGHDPRARMFMPETSETEAFAEAADPWVAPQARAGSAIATPGTLQERDDG
ncbi:MAG: hypothetical protein JNM58_11600 [Xanthomonadaceae bacterium]|nr:hypothetical protein [Xanthomonadaceae bacterium]